jgi:hypothetical protein
VKRASWNPDQVTRLNFNCDNRAFLGMDVEQSSPIDNVPDLVLIMAMFDIELREHSIESWSISVHVYDVRSNIPTATFKFINLY